MHALALCLDALRMKHVGVHQPAQELTATELPLAWLVAPLMVAPCMSKGDPPALWGIWMKILQLVFSG